MSKTRNQLTKYDGLWELLLRNEYLVTENRLLRNQLKGRVRLSDGERKAMAEIGYRLGRQALQEVATIVKPDTLLGWHRTLVAKKFDGSTQHKAPGRPKIDPELAVFTLIYNLVRLVILQSAHHQQVDVGTDQLYRCPAVAL